MLKLLQTVSKKILYHNPKWNHSLYIDVVQLAKQLQKFIRCYIMFVPKWKLRLPRDSLSFFQSASLPYCLIVRILPCIVYLHVQIPRENPAVQIVSSKYCEK